MNKIPCAIVGSGNIGTDLAKKLQCSNILDVRYVVGIDPDSDGLREARAAGIEASHEGVPWLLERSADIRMVFEATSARVHTANAPLYEEHGLVAIDLTPAAIGPPVVPLVNLHEHRTAMNMNLITCGGQATVPIVAAVASATHVAYAEIVSTIASRSAGPGTRQNIDEFTKTTAAALVDVGGAELGKAIMILNPAEPPIIMRNTVYCAISGHADEQQVAAAVRDMVARVSEYVPGYRLVDAPQFDDIPGGAPWPEATRRVAVLLEVEGAGDSLPPYAGNLDIITAAARKIGEMIAMERFSAGART